MLNITNGKSVKRDGHGKTRNAHGKVIESVFVMSLGILAMSLKGSHCLWLTSMKMA